ncbi:hypothetical protein OC846_006060 [Tilletia horrida]|uniref:DUF2415 domain-containing protein n=1 Tax=Tilletia horrida TaxID=155126 RepID=A0AAN6GJL3_9BASI|nr:hypothetical protein OC846_006060 [Tilletia horrida]
MTKDRNHVSTEWVVKHRAGLDPPHGQLKDLMWPGTRPNTVVYASNDELVELTFAPHKQPRAQVSASLKLQGAKLHPDFMLIASALPLFPPRRLPYALCYLEFPPCCLAVAGGLLAVGGKKSELSFRSLAAPSSHLTSPARGSWSLEQTPCQSTINAIALVPDTPYGIAPGPVTPASQQGLPFPSRSQDRQEYSSTDRCDPDPRSTFFTMYDRQDRGWRDYRDALDPDDLEDRQQSEETAAAYGFPWRQQYSSPPRLPTSSSSSSSSPFSFPPFSRSQASSASSSIQSYPYGRPAQSSWRSHDAGTTAPKLIRDSQTHASSLYVPSYDSSEGGGSVFRVNVATNAKTVRSYRIRGPAGPRSLQFERFTNYSPLKVTNYPTPINHTATSPDRRTMIALGDTDDVFVQRILPSGDFENVSVLKGSGGGAFSSSWHPSGMQFAVGSSDGRVHVWDVRSSRPLLTMETTSDPRFIADSDIDAIRNVKYSPCGRMLAYTSHLESLWVVDTISYQNRQHIAVPRPDPLMPDRPIHAPNGPRPTSGPFMGPEEDDFDAPEAPPPQGTVSDERSWDRIAHPESRSRHSSSQARARQEVQQWWVREHRHSSSYSSVAPGAPARDYPYRNPHRSGGPTTSGGIGHYLGSTAGPSHRTSQSPWVQGSSRSNELSAPASSSSRFQTYNTSSNPSSIAFDPDLHRLLRRSRAQNTADEQRLARRAYLSRRRSLLDGREWPSLAEAALAANQDREGVHHRRRSPPLSPGRRDEESLPLLGRQSGRGSGGQQRRLTEYFAPSSSSSWLDHEDGIELPPPVSAVPGRQYAIHPIRSRSPFSGAAVSSEYLRQIDQRSLSALQDYQRRQQQSSQVEASIQPTGLCWEPDGSALYCSTTDLVARYPVIDLRTSSTHASLI